MNRNRFIKNNNKVLRIFKSFANAIKAVFLPVLIVVLLLSLYRTNATYRSVSIQPVFQKPLTPIDSPPPLPYNFSDNKGEETIYNDQHKLYLNNPSNVKTNIEYDPQEKKYIIQQKIGDQRYRPDTYLDAEEYQDYMFKKAVRNYWRSKIAAEDLNKPKKGLIPSLQVNNELFDRIFGGNTIDIRPTGTIELIFGINRMKNLNPALPQRQQKVTNFDFNMRIQLNLLGKIGEKFKINMNYNTEANFDWENQVKLDWAGGEDDILKKIEAGNVTLPLNSSLITGSQSLFGIKLTTQWGKLTATTVFAQQRGKRQEVTVQGGSQTQPFTITADNYEANKHFFLSHYFMKNYDKWMSTLPVINSPIVITKVEVYVLNQTGTTDQNRNVVAFEDLGEDTADVYVSMKNPSCIANPNYVVTDSAGIIPHNGANSLYYIVSNPTTGILKDRVSTNIAATIKNATSNSCNSSNDYMVQSRDFDIIYNARKLNPSEYTLNSRLGYISLNQSLNNDQVLAISFQYTYNGKTYQVGEFSDQFPDNNKVLITKLLKGANVNVRYPTWKLMMKNVYAIGAYNINPQNFNLQIYYNNIETGVDIPYIPYGAVNGQLLIRVLGLDNLTVNGDKHYDGVFDFLPGYTINPANGRIYFTSVEPFGNYLKSKFSANDFPNANKYIFQELYDSLKVAAQQIPEKNRYKIKGTYTSSSGSEISLNALNIPQGAVVVTANGVRLTENVDYTVDYTLGRVKIINDGLLNSGAQIKVSVESNSLFNIQQKSLIGTRLDYKVNRDLLLGGTFMRYSERPMTQKVTFGDEPVSNIIWGLDYNYKTETPFLTRLLDKLPLYSTKEKSFITTQGEFAQLIPGNAAAINQNKGTSYIDDFEGSVNTIDLRSPQSWKLASIPQGQSSLFPEASLSDSIATNFNRSRLSWYTVDPALQRQQSGITPSYYNKNVYSNNFFRQVLETELFPLKTPPNGQPVLLPVLDLAYFPSERGPYNFDINPTPISAGIDPNTGKLKSPETRWAGIMRNLTTNDFFSANVEYIQFWLMDPFNSDYKSTTYPDMDAANPPSGELIIHLGNVSEDILKDGRMSYENGLPGVSAATQNLPVSQSSLAIVPSVPPITNAFSSDPNDRTKQDVGYDGMDDGTEKQRYQYLLSQIQGGGFNTSAPLIQEFLSDPASDNYHFFRGDDYDQQQLNTIYRYKKYNNPQGNSPTEAQYKNQNSGGYSTVATTMPDIEDLNRDNTLSETENYYQYKIRISKSDINPARVGQNYIVNSFETTADIEGVKKTVRWYQFKIPVTEFEKAIGNIEGFNSIRFMRMIVKGFDKPVILRFARFELVRTDWRRYPYDLSKPGEYIAHDNTNTSFDVSAVSLQENGTKTPVNYVMPPGIQQQQNVQTTNLVLLNEQALQMRVVNLEDGDARAIYKNTELDARMFKKMRMFVHAEKIPTADNLLKDGDLTLFVRLGTDYNDNYYEYELPLKLTPAGKYDNNSENDKYIVWPEDNEVVIDFDELVNVKQARNKYNGSNFVGSQNVYQVTVGTRTISVRGNPNLGTIRSIMVGIRNPKDPSMQMHSAEVWINELRLTDFNNKGGWATTGKLQAQLADLGTANIAGTYSTPFFGSVDKKINERSKETNLNWDFSTQLQLGKFFPQKWKVSLPFYYNYGETRIIPLFNPFDPDVKTKDISKSDYLDKEDIQKMQNDAMDYTRRKGFNFTNVRIEGLKNKKMPPLPTDLSNFTFSYAYNEQLKHNVNIDHQIIKQYKFNLTYQYTIKVPSIKPFDKIKLFDKPIFALIKNFNFQPLPNSYGFSTDITRNYSELLNRDITSFYFNEPDKTLTQYNKQFLWTRNYSLRWDLSKSLKFDYNATNNGRILEPYGAIDTKDKKDSVKQEFKRGGTTTDFKQTMNLNYQVPLNLIPYLEFINLSYKYTGNYQWTRRPFAAADTIGNVIQNSNNQNWTANFSMTMLYGKIKFIDKMVKGTLFDKPTKSKKNKVDSDTAKTSKNNKNKPNVLSQVLQVFGKTITMVKTISISFQEQKGTTIPNFKPSSQYLGVDGTQQFAPGFGFAAGLQKDILPNAIEKGWISKNIIQTSPITKNYSKTFNYRASIEPPAGIRIEVNGNQNFTQNLSQYLVWDTITKQYTYVSPNESGNFSISIFTLDKAFKEKWKGAESQLFKDFLELRKEYAQLLSSQNPNSSGVLLDGNGNSYYDGYGYTQQDVLIGAFYNAYTGKKIKNYNTKNPFPSFPMPNWNITFDGLGKIAFLQKWFKTITLKHSYKSTYTIGGYTNNLLYDELNGYQFSRSPVQNPIVNGIQTSQNFNPKYNIASVTIQEAFAPLIRVDFNFVKPGWQANFEIKKDKTVNLNLTGPQITETKGQEYVVGIGYRYPKLKINKIKIQGKVLESDLNVKIDISYRKNLNVVRRVSDGVTLPTTGADIFSLRSSATYQITSNIALRIFYDWIKNIPQTSNTYPTSNTNAGFSLRISFQ
ncbi:MAG: cell surface protein SprA [Bacteroidia bacterium]|nr:cell surface protein SprA [Bacteroidia bacterium]